MELKSHKILLGYCTWSANKDRNDGTFPILVNGVVHTASFELKCYASNVHATEVSKTIKNNEKNNHLITIMVVTKAGKIKNSNKSFNEAAQNCNVIKIVGNASAELPVATTLNWVTVRPIPEVAVHPNPEGSAGADRTVVMIVLESIFAGRYAEMQGVYRST
jgi:hypothetical protein